MTSYPESGPCAFCGERYSHFGNNPEPLMDFERRVCDDCNAEFVIPARIRRMNAGLHTRSLEVKNAEDQAE